MFDITLLPPRLHDCYQVEYHAEIVSTNDRALEYARHGDATRRLIIADYQTAGRGRRGAIWTAPPGSSLLFSCVLPLAQPLPPHQLAILTGVGLANGLQGAGMPVKIKWPNDLMYEDRKIGGILVETVGAVLVVGCGINCHVPSEAFPEAIRARAGSLHALAPAIFTRENLLVALIDGLEGALTRAEDGGIIKLLYAWNTMNWLARRKVRVTGPLGSVDGDGLFLNGQRLVFHVFKDHGVVAMPLSSTVEAR